MMTSRPRSKTHKKRSNRTLLNQTKQDRVRIFEGILFFKATNNTKTTKLLPAGFFKENVCTRLTYLLCVFDFFFSRLYNQFPPFSPFSTALWELANSRPVHSLMLSSNFFFCLPCLLPLFTVSLSWMCS